MLAPDSEFRELIDRLVGQHEADIRSAVTALRQENRLLREEVAELRGDERHAAAGSLGSQCSESFGVDQLAKARAVLCPLPAAPKLPGWPGNWLADGNEHVPTADGCAGEPALPGSLGSSPAATPRAQCSGLVEEVGQPVSLAAMTDADPDDGSRANFGGIGYRIPASEVTRFLQMFSIDMWNTNTAVISAYDLHAVLEQRGLRQLSTQRVSWVMQRLFAAHEQRLSSVRQSPTSTAHTRCTEEKKHLHGFYDDDDFSLPFSVFMSIIFSKDIAKGLSIDSIDVAEDAKQWQQTLLTQTIEEVIDRLALCGSPPKIGASRNGRSSRVKQVTRSATFRSLTTGRAMRVLNSVVAIMVAVSVVSMSLSMDYCVDCEAWFYLEISAAAVFIIELLAKFSVYGCKELLFGEDWKWNVSDMFITFVQLLEVGIAILTRIQGLEMDEAPSIGHVVVALRALRVLRFARLVKMLRSPLLKELANMLQGFMLGIPALLWVSVLISIVVWVFGAALRSVVGPTPGRELLTDKCGFDGDNANDPGHRDVVEEFPECGNRPQLYADEYCPTVAKCSFTVFRCMIGDCSSKGGQSLPGHLSAGYNESFDLIYVLGMIGLIFGLFNIITAVFVESTMKGLAAEDKQVKRQEKYQVRHVKRSLQHLVLRIANISEIYKASHALDEEDLQLSTGARLFKRLQDSVFSNQKVPDLQRSRNDEDAPDLSKLTLSEGAFNEVLKDDCVQCILRELDIDLGTDNAGVFHLFKTDKEGQLPLPEMLVTMMKVRGDTSKADFIGPSVLIKTLTEAMHGDIHELQEMILASHKVLQKCKSEILRLTEQRRYPSTDVICR